MDLKNLDIKEFINQLSNKTILWQTSSQVISLVNTQGAQSLMAENRQVKDW